MNQTELTKSIKIKSSQLGFDAVGITSPGKMGDAIKRLNKWLEQGMHGTMAFMANSAEKRIHPCNIMSEVKSIIVLAHNYYQVNRSKSKYYRISKYAHGKDYHDVLRRKAKLLLEYITELIPCASGQICVDSAPIFEKAYAQKAGLGWIGKNGILILPRLGSYFFLCELLIDIELDYDKPETDHCGRCRLCLDACPTGAIPEPYVVNASECVSYLTIEHKGEMPMKMKSKYNKWIFGCDDCQDVCPFNRFAKSNSHPDFQPSNEMAKMSNDDWKNLTEVKFNQIFEGSTIKRTGYEKFMRNIRFLDD
ncbi:MAG: tRNA epoxyqueuosine(34) reductase QueG [Candidatus Zixiibacteriota bacterium]